MPVDGEERRHEDKGKWQVRLNVPAATQWACTAYCHFRLARHPDNFKERLQMPDKNNCYG